MQAELPQHLSQLGLLKMFQRTINFGARYTISIPQLLYPPGAYLLLAHLIEWGGGGGLFEKGVGAYLTWLR